MADPAATATATAEVAGDNSDSGGQLGTAFDKEARGREPAAPVRGRATTGSVRRLLGATSGGGGSARPMATAGSGRRRLRATSGDGRAPQPPTRRRPGAAPSRSPAVRRRRGGGGGGRERRRRHRDARVSFFLRFFRFFIFL